MEQDDFSKKLQRILHEKNILCKDFAQKCDLSEASLSRYLNDTRRPSFEILKRMCENLECSSDYLIGLTNFYTEKENGEKYKNLIDTLEKCWKCPSHMLDEKEQLYRIMIAYREYRKNEK